MTDTKTVLKELESSISLETTAEFLPKEYFQDCDGLYVWNDFKNRIVEKAESIAAGTKFVVSFSELTEYASDEKVEASLPKEHLFSESDVCAIISELIAKQPKSEEGALQNTGYANFFYTPSFVVDVRWDVVGWSVDAWYRGGLGWIAGGRVFSPA